jgi:HEAT repeat protein
MGLLLLAAPQLYPATAEEEELAADKACLKTAGVSADSTDLVDFFKKRTLTDKDRGHIAELIQQLGSDDFDERETASESLTNIGAVARPQLRDAARSTDAEVRLRARRCLAAIGKTAGTADVLSAAARVLAATKTAGVADVLLNYLPNIEEPEAVDEVGLALATAGLREGKVEAALVKGLTDKMPIKRAAAGAALARVGGAAHRPAVRKLLKDEKIEVRRRVALALVDAKDKEAVPALIALLADSAVEDRDAVEEKLGLVAGDKAPAYPTLNSEEARKKYLLAWESWWKANGEKLDMAKIDLGKSMLGYTVIAQLGFRGGKGKIARQNGKVFELDRAGKVRWTIENLNYPVCAEVVRGNRVLICEYTMNQISERDFKGEIIWKKSLTSSALGVQRLRTGGTFVYSRNQLIELDKAGKEVVTINRPGWDIVAAYRDKEGHIGMAASNGMFIKMDRTGKEIKSFRIGFVNSGLGASIQMLPRGRVLAPNYNQNKVVEYDESGKVVWEASVSTPGSVRRLPNGHTVVTSRLGREVIILDRAGKTVWSKKCDGNVLYANRR